MTLGSYVKILNVFLEKNENLKDFELKHAESVDIEFLPEGKYLMIDEKFYTVQQIIVKKV